MGNCLCGHGESCEYCDTTKQPRPNKRIKELEKTLREIDQSIEEAMGETFIGAKALLSLRWARKLIARALGEADD